MKKVFILSLFIFSLSSFGMAKRDLTFVPSSEVGDQVINRRYYQLSYSNEHEQAEWVYYKLSKKLIDGKAERTDRFVADPDVIDETALSDDYTNTGFDRGHLLPAADMKVSQKAMQETFYMSNISPQLPEFNRKIWKKLEKKVREFVKDKGSLYVITGPVLEKGLPTIDKNVSIPQMYYKILVHKHGENIETISFLLPHEESKKELSEFIVSVDDIEKVTGIDFFKQLDSEVEQSLERRKYNGKWF